VQELQNTKDERVTQDQAAPTGRSQSMPPRVVRIPVAGPAGEPETIRVAQETPDGRPVSMEASTKPPMDTSKETRVMQEKVTPEQVSVQQRPSMEPMTPRVTQEQAASVEQGPVAQESFAKQEQERVAPEQETHVLSQQERETIMNIPHWNTPEPSERVAPELQKQGRAAIETNLDEVPVTRRRLAVDARDRIDNPGLARVNKAVDVSHPQGTPGAPERRSVLEMHADFFDR
jgi:hypothetical protein